MSYVSESRYTFLTDSVLESYLMESPSKKDIVEILKKYDLGTLKKFGQNFLIDKNIIKKMVDLIEPDETVVEVGPGFGSLTISMSERAKKIIAIEKDDGVAEAFENEFLKSLPNVTLVKNDILKVGDIFPSIDYTVLANLPFYITSPVIRMFLENDNPPQRMILMMQKEVAKRICSKPPNMSILSVSVQFYANPKIIFHVSRNSFWPVPGVDCSVMIIEKKKPVLNINSALFFKIVKAGFSHPRAQLLNNLSKGLRLDKKRVQEIMISSKIDPKRRAESLDLKDWIILTEKL